MSVAVTINTLVCDSLAAASKRDRTQLSQQTRLAQLAIDSLSITTLIAQLEAALAIRLSADEKMSIYDAEDISSIVAVATAAVNGGAAR